MQKKKKQNNDELLQGMVNAYRYLQFIMKNLNQQTEVPEIILLTPDVLEHYQNGATVTIGECQVAVNPTDDTIQFELFGSMEVPCDPQ